MFDVLGALTGLSSALFSIVPLTMIINNWFVKKHGLATSIVFGFSGLAGSLCSPILTAVISSSSWQVAYIVKAAIILGLCLPAIVYPFNLDPQDEDLKPYGFEYTQGENEAVSTKPISFAFASIGFLSFFVFGMMASCITSVTQHFPGFAQSVGFDASLGALLLSAGMVGNIVFKIVIGVLSDRLGALKATLVTLLINMAGIFLLLTGLSSGILLLGAFFFGSSYAIGAVGVPLLTKYFFGTEVYSTVFPKISFASNFGAALSFTLVGYIYDLSGSYSLAFIFSLIMIAICFSSLAICYKATHTQKQIILEK